MSHEKSMSDQERLQTLRSAASNANPIGFVAILTRDLRWLLQKAEGGKRKAEETGSDPSSFGSPLSTLDSSPEIPDDPELN